jgi:hypothetical protein
MDTIRERSATLAGRGAPKLDTQHIIDDDRHPITTDVADVKIELLLDDIGASIGPIECQLACLAAHVAAGDSTGVVYALKRLRAQWRCLDLDAQDLITADGERLSALRQMEAAQ